MGYDALLKKGTTDYIATIKMRDSSTGLFLTGLDHTDITAHYVRDGADAVAITEVSGILNTFVSGGWVETAKGGAYQLGVPNLALATGSDGVLITVSATGAIDSTYRIVLTSIDIQDAADLGVTALTGHTPQTGDSFARLGAPAGASIAADIADVPTVSEFNARTLAAADYFDAAADTVANVTNVANVTGNVAGSVNSVTTGVTLADNAITAAKIAADAITAAKVASDAITEIQNGLSTFDATSDTVALADGGITAAKIASDAITAAKIAADAITEIQSGLSTLDTTDVETAAGAALTTYDAATGTDVTAIGTTIAALNDFDPDTQTVTLKSGTHTGAVVPTVTTVTNNVNTNANATETAIKAKTDNLPAQPASTGDITALGTTIGEPLQADDYTAPPSTSAIATAVWANGTRTLSSFGTLVADVAAAVWSAVTRTLTSGGGGSAPTAAEVAEEVNEVLSTAHGSGPWGSDALGSGAYTATITVTDGTDPIQGARVRLSRAGETKMGTTDADGVVAIPADAFDWTMVVTATGYDGSISSLTVNGNETAEVELTAITYSASGAPDLCRVHFDLFQLGAEDVSGQVVRFAIQGTANQPTLIGNEIVPSGTEYEAESDEDGVGYMDLPYSSLITNGEIYVTSSAARLKGKLITVPDAASALLVDLI